MLSPEQIERLTKLGPEQLAIAEKWDKEREALDKLVDAAKKSFEDGDKSALQNVLDQIERISPDMCEHDRSIWSPCLACEEIEMAINPELYDEDGYLIQE